MKYIIRSAALAILALMLCCSAALAWYCPNCFAENNQNFCVYCGHEQPERFCENCGTEVGADYVFCPACGWELNYGRPTLNPNQVHIGFNDILDTCRSEAATMLITIPHEDLDYYLHYSCFPIWVDHEAMMDLGADLLTANTLPLPECMQGSWDVFIYVNHRLTTTTHDGLSSICSINDRSHITAIQFMRDGLLYDFSYQDGQIISYDLLLSQNPNVTDPFTIRYDAPYCEWNYLAGCYYYASEEDSRIRITLAPQGIDSVNSLPTWSQEYSIEYGYIF